MANENEVEITVIPENEMKNFVKEVVKKGGKNLTLTHPDYMDKEKPELKNDEVLCSGCWAVTNAKVNWIFMRFKFLDCAWLCPTCARKYYMDFAELQRQGL